MTNVIPTPYSNNDKNYKQDFDTALVRNLNLDTNQNYDVYAASNIVAYPGYSVDDLMTIENSFSRMETKYNDVTEVIKIGNDLQNVNQYINNSYVTEKKRIGGVLNHSQNDVYLSRESFMLTKYNIAFNNFLTYVIQFSIFTAIICAFIILFTLEFDPERFKSFPHLNWRVAGTILLFISAIYILGVVIFYRQTLVRRKDDWTKFYFNTPDKLNGKTCNK